MPSITPYHMYHIQNGGNTFTVLNTEFTLLGLKLTLMTWTDGTKLESCHITLVTWHTCVCIYSLNLHVT